MPRLFKVWETSVQPTFLIFMLICLLWASICTMMHVCGSEDNCSFIPDTDLGRETWQHTPLPTEALTSPQMLVFVTLTRIIELVFWVIALNLWISPHFPLV